MDGLADEFAGRVSVVQLNVGEPDKAEIQQSYGMRGHPTAVLIDTDGEVVQQYFGPEDVEVLREDLTAVAE